MSYKPQSYNQFESENAPGHVYSDMNQQQPQVIVQNPAPASFAMDSPPSTFAWCDFIMSIIGFLFCNMWFSLLGMVYAANSYVSHGEKLYEKARRQSSVARIFWIISFVLGVIVWIIAIIAIAIVVNQAKQTVETMETGYNGK